VKKCFALVVTTEEVNDETLGAAEIGRVIANLASEE
jgi:hypothetical protein